MTELERCLEFIRGIAHRAATEKVPSEYGVGLLHPGYPRVWSRNYLLAEENLDGVSAELLAAEADRVLGGAGLAHRKVELYDEKVGSRLEQDFESLGWTSECDVIMVARRDADRDTDTTGVDEVSFDDLASALAEATRNEPHGTDEEVVRQLVDNKQAVMAAIQTRFFAARVSDDIASFCELYSDGSTGQIEAVLTLAPYRNRGLARSTVMRALAESRAAGNDLTFLIADRDDWPKKLYEKLGFDEIGRIYEFVRAGSS
jgi:ribosomal protein S18 acetylase RimI-like enzyme